MEYALELTGITKRFGSLVANDHIDLKVERGSVHAVIGENGAGKSTLMNIVSAIHQPDSGEIKVNGSVVRFRNTLDATRHGIGMVHQEFMLYPDFTVWENIISGFEQKTLGAFVNRKKSVEAIGDICRKYNFNIPLNAKVAELPVSMLQQVEIVKVLYRGVDIIILDEPTSVLTPQGIDGLFAAIRFLKGKGKTILIITHKLKEVFAIADAISVLRGGRLVKDVLPSEITEQQLANLMVGSEVMLKAQKLPCDPGKAVLEVKGLNITDGSGVRRVKDASFDVRAGEIVGIAGVAGSGQQQLIEAVIGLREPDRGGQIRMFGKSVLGKSIRERRLRGLAYVPQNRMAQGVNPVGSVWENAIMGYYIVKGFSGKFWLRRGEISAYTHSVIRNYSVKVQDIGDRVLALSGGNIQKLVVGREFSQDRKLLVIEDPSRGIDVGAIEFVWKKIIELAHSGVGVLLVSHELNEVMELSDRILVAYDGMLLDGGRRGEKGEYDIGLMMMGGEAK